MPRRRRLRRASALAVLFRKWPLPTSGSKPWNATAPSESWPRLVKEIIHRDLSCLFHVADPCPPSWPRSFCWRRFSASSDSAKRAYCPRQLLLQPGCRFLYFVRHLGDCLASSSLLRLSIPLLWFAWTQSFLIPGQGEWPDGSKGFDHRRRRLHRLRADSAAAQRGTSRHGP